MLQSLHMGKDLHSCLRAWHSHNVLHAVKNHILTECSRSTCSLQVNTRPAAYSHVATVHDVCHS